ncbi:hypothetical protein [Treponema zioleckii]|uniref:hypothetical protein n=1 Tax=Treponema zioleckii TaxID=331680 RepID=UPI00168B3D1C|nr:hypothetical protein [Treponema zioleckii]
MTRAETYNTEYVKMNHAYIQLFESYQVLMQADDVDEEVKQVLESVFMVLNPTLDRIKSEMTVKTRYKTDSSSNKTQKGKSSEIVTEESNGGKVFHPKF